MAAFGSEPPARFEVPPREECTVQFLCPRCRETFVWATADIPAPGIRLVCPGCELEFGGELRPRRSRSLPSACWLCGRGELYAEKDVNPTPWWFVVLSSLALGTLVALFVDPFLGVGALGLAALSEALIYRSLSECAACAVCGTVYRGFSGTSGLARRPAGLASKFLEERERWVREILARQKLET